MTVNTGDILQVRAKYSYGVDDYVNVYHFKADFTASQTDLAVLGAVRAMLDDAYDHLDTLISNNVTFDTIEVINLTQDMAVGEDDWVTLTAGANVDSPLPTQVACVVRFFTNVLGSQGRKFLSTFTETENVYGGTLSAGLTTALGNYAAEILAGVVISAGNELIPGNWNATLARFAEWTSAFINERMGTQRRRKVGVGE